MCSDGDGLLVVADTGDVICVTYGAAGIETTTLGRAAPGAVAAAPVAGGVALLAEGFVVFYPRRPFTERACGRAVNAGRALGAPRRRRRARRSRGRLDAPDAGPPRAAAAARCKTTSRRTAPATAAAPGLA